MMKTERKEMKLKASYIAKLNKMTSKEIVELLDKVTCATSFNFGTKVERKKNSEKIDLLTKTIVKIILKNYPDVAKKEGYRKALAI